MTTRFLQMVYLLCVSNDRLQPLIGNRNDWTSPVAIVINKQLSFFFFVASITMTVLNIP